ncbi:MAG: MarR family transcriptional regulator [bacterium]
MDPYGTLRDRTGTTRLLILATLDGNPGATLSDVAKRLGVTVQAVSMHAKGLAKDGLLAQEDGRAAPTARGLQSLHEGVRQLRDAVASLASPLDVIQVTSAVAAAPVKAGQDVGLWMADGDLEARPGRDAASRGRARNDAKRGEEVIVADLKGMVGLEPGRLRVVSLPAPAEGGIARIDTARLATDVRRSAWHKVGAHGTGARILARGLAKAGLLRLDFEFAADRAAFNAAERGLDVLLFASRDRLAEVLSGFERQNDVTLRRVAVELAEAPERHA